MDHLRERRTMLGVCAGFFFFAGVLLEDPYIFGGHFRLVWEGLMFIASSSVALVMVWPWRRWTRVLSIAAVTVASTLRGLALMLEFELWLPGLQWIFIAYLLALLWPYLLPKPFDAREHRLQ